MDRAADKAARLSDFLADLNGLAGFNNGVCRTSGVLAERDNDVFGVREADKRAVLAELLALRRMDAAVIALKPLLADRFYILFNKLVIYL